MWLIVRNRFEQMCGQFLTNFVDFLASCPWQHEMTLNATAPKWSLSWSASTSSDREKPALEEPDGLQPEETLSTQNIWGWFIQQSPWEAAITAQGWGTGAGAGAQSPRGPQNCAPDPPEECTSSRFRVANSSDPGGGERQNSQPVCFARDDSFLPIQVLTISKLLRSTWTISIAQHISLERS